MRLLPFDDPQFQKTIERHRKIVADTRFIDENIEEDSLLFLRLRARASDNENTRAPTELAANVINFCLCSVPQHRFHAVELQVPLLAAAGSQRDMPPVVDLPEDWFDGTQVHLAFDRDPIGNWRVSCHGLSQELEIEISTEDRVLWRSNVGSRPVDLMDVELSDVVSVVVMKQDEYE